MPELILFQSSPAIGTVTPIWILLSPIMVPIRVSILLGTGDGTFQTPLEYNVGSSPTFVAGGDFNGNGTR